MAGAGSITDEERATACNQIDLLPHWAVYNHVGRVFGDHVKALGNRSVQLMGISQEDLEAFDVETSQKMKRVLQYFVNHEGKFPCTEGAAGRVRG